MGQGGGPARLRDAPRGVLQRQHKGSGPQRQTVWLPEHAPLVHGDERGVCGAGRAVQRGTFMQCRPGCRPGAARLACARPRHACSLGSRPGCGLAGGWHGCWLRARCGALCAVPPAWVGQQDAKGRVHVVVRKCLPGQSHHHCEGDQQRTPNGRVSGRLPPAVRCQTRQ